METSCMQNGNNWNWCLNQSIKNFYSVNIPSVARSSGAVAESVFSDDLMPWSLTYHKDCNILNTRTCCYAVVFGLFFFWFFLKLAYNDTQGTVQGWYIQFLCGESTCHLGNFTQFQVCKLPAGGDFRWCVGGTTSPPVYQSHILEGSLFSYFREELGYIGFIYLLRGAGFTYERLWGQIMTIKTSSCHHGQRTKPQWKQLRAGFWRKQSRIWWYTCK